MSEGHTHTTEAPEPVQTLDELLATLRNDAAEDIAYSPNDIRRRANQIESAAKRGYEEVKSYFEKLHDGPSMVCTAKNCALRNAAALREALEKVHKAFRDGLIGAHAIATDTEAEALFRLWHTEIPAALAAPARNCDVGTAAEQKARHDRFCSRHYKAECVDSQCFGCPAHDEKTETDCEFVWGQLPFDQAEGGAKCIDGLRGHPDCRGCDEHCLDVRKRNCFYWNPDIGKCALDGKPSCRIACDNFRVSKEEKPGPAEGCAE